MGQIKSHFTHIKQPKPNHGIISQQSRCISPQSQSKTICLRFLLQSIPSPMSSTIALIKKIKMCMCLRHCRSRINLVINLRQIRIFNVYRLQLNSRRWKKKKRIVQNGTEDVGIDGTSERVDTKKRVKRNYPTYVLKHFQKEKLQCNPNTYLLHSIVVSFVFPISNVSCLLFHLPLCPICENALSAHTNGEERGAAAQHKTRYNNAMAYVWSYLELEHFVFARVASRYLFPFDAVEREIIN